MIFWSLIKIGGFRLCNNSATDSLTLTEKASYTISRVILRYNMDNLKQDRLFSWDDINSTRLFVFFMGLLAGLTGFVHGLYETFQGNTPTGGNVIASFGIFTLIPNYLLTGIAAVIVALSVAIWTIGFIHKKNGPTVSLLLAILLFLVGGGVAIVFFTPFVWGAATRIDKPLTWWRKALPENVRKLLARYWPAIFIIGSTCLSIGIGIWLFLTPPGPSYKDPVLQQICWIFVGLGFLLQMLTIMSGFARDIQRQESIVISKHH